MYFIQHGVVKVESSQSPDCRHLADGSYFGGIALTLPNLYRFVCIVVHVTTCLFVCLTVCVTNISITGFIIIQPVSIFALLYIIVVQHCPVVAF